VSTEHRKRIASGLGYAVVMLGSAWLSPWAFVVVGGGLLVFAVREARALFQGDALALQIMGLALVGLSFLCLIALAFILPAASLLSLLISAFIFDTFAYYGGKFLKGPKLIPRVSPQKTWAGLLVGIAGLVVCQLLLSQFVAPFPFLRWVAAGSDQSTFFVIRSFDFLLLLSLLFLMGDLSISFLKRRKGMKDTGALLPGHGGILDRADSLLFVGPLFVLLSNWIDLAA